MALKEVCIQLLLTLCDMNSYLVKMSKVKHDLNKNHFINFDMHNKFILNTQKKPHKSKAYTNTSLVMF